MKQLIIFSLFIIWGTPGSSQALTITGKIKNENRDSLSFASVFIFSQKNLTKPVAEKIANEDGSFEIILATKGTYIIKISHEAYKDFNREIEMNDPLILDSIILSKKESQLSTVLVTAKKPFISRKLDRVVMNVQDNAAATGKSSLDLFEMAPGVFVNNGNISINGVWGSRVMVNGRMLHLSGNDLKNYLQNLKASDIKSIDIIAHPPAEYAFYLQKLSFIAQTQQDIIFSKTFSMNLNAFYMPNVVTGNIVTGRVASVDIGFQKKLLGKKLLAKAVISDIFYTNNFKASSYYYGSVIRITQKEQTRLLTLSLMYNFSMGKSFSQKKIQNSNADEKSRL